MSKFDFLVWTWWTHTVKSVLYTVHTIRYINSASQHSPTITFTPIQHTNTSHSRILWYTRSFTWACDRQRERRCDSLRTFQHFFAELLNGSSCVIQRPLANCQIEMTQFGADIFFFLSLFTYRDQVAEKKYDFYNAEIVYTNHWMQLAIKWKSLLLCLYVDYCETNMTVTYFVLSRITRFIQNIFIFPQLCRLDSIFVFNFTFQTKPIQKGNLSIFLFK